MQNQRYINIEKPMQVVKIVHFFNVHAAPFRNSNSDSTIESSFKNAASMLVEKTQTDFRISINILLPALWIRWLRYKSSNMMLHTDKSICDTSNICRSEESLQGKSRLFYY